MRYTFVAASVGLGVAFVTPVIFAQPVSIGTDTPDSYEQVKSAMEQIPPALNAAQCGGTVDASVAGKIATVQGVPGRPHIWDKAILSGMGVREDSDGNDDEDDDFEFPESVVGLTNACEPGRNRIEKWVWRPKEGGFPGEIEEQLLSFHHPYFEDPVCRWRANGGGMSNQMGSRPGAFTPLDYQQIEEPNSPSTCAGACQYINQFTYVDCEIPYQDLALVPDGAGGVVGVPFIACGVWSSKFICTDQLWNDRESCNPAQPSTEWPNASTCQGEECRCPNPDPQNNECRSAPGFHPYNSYARFYQGAYSRAALGPAVPRDQSAKQAPVACFGFYNEFDPRYEQTTFEDRRCVINVDVADMRETQKGKGNYGQAPQLPDRNPNEAGNQREGGNYDMEEDLWYQKLSGGFSLLSEKVFKDEYQQDLTNVFLDLDHLDKASMRATEQLTQAQPLAKSTSMRAFDDTGVPRTIATWWQKQQTAMSSLLHPPSVRILLPVNWAFGVDPEDPFFRTHVRETTDEIDRRNKRIEIQIDADEDILGTALAYIERSMLLRVEEQPVPVLVPIGSASEFRAKAIAWCTWHMRQNNVNTCDGAPEEVKNLIAKLENYADTVDEVRVLRGELARYAGKVLELQHGLTQPISDWVLANIRNYRAVLREQQQIREGFAQDWHLVQSIYNDFHDQANLPWCMNQRFTAPIYSLLDEWMPSRKDEGSITADELPNITPRPKEDLVVDFSTIIYSSETLPLPVLQPIQVRIGDIPWPPAGKEHGLTEEYPDLPSVERVREQIRNAENNLPRPPENPPRPAPLEFDLIGEQGLADLRGKMDEIISLLGGMNMRYDKFWKSIGPLRPNEPDGGRWGIKYMKEHLECMDWDDETCQHVEMDLVERFMRIGSRPLVLLKEDYESRTGVRIPGADGYQNLLRGMGGTCVAADDVCTPVNPENTMPRHQWEVISPENPWSNTDEIRSNIRNVTLPEPVGDIDPDDFPTYDTDIRQLLPTFDVPRAIDLFPSSSSSSSGS